MSKANTVATRLAAAQLPLSVRTDFAVLAALEEYGPLSQAELGRRLGLDRNDVSGVVDRLSTQSHVVRQPDPDDGRRNRVFVTAVGRAYLDELQSATDAVQADLASNLSESEASQLRGLLAKLLEVHPFLPS